MGLVEVMAILILLLLLLLLLLRRLMLPAPTQSSRPCGSRNHRFVDEAVSRSRNSRLDETRQRAAERQERATKGNCTRGREDQRPSAGT